MTPVQIEENILASSELVELCAQLGSRAAIVTDSHVEDLYGHRFEQHLKDHGLDVYLFSFPGGEFYKTRTTKEMLEDQMQDKGLGKDTCLIGLGGGVVTDVAGFIASTYCRGIPYICCPTTLLGMVDASIGGKTGVNTSFGKNLIGTFYSPEMVYIDTTTLRTLTQKEIRNGTVEMIKHALVSDALYFEFFENHLERIHRVELGFITEAIEASCRIKQKIVKSGGNEDGKRHLLNFGHTIGHAIETAADYKLSHGEAVAMGLIAESYLSMKLGRLDEGSFERIEKVLRDNHPELYLPREVTPKILREAMAMDKKSKKSRPRFSVLKAIGAPMECDGDFCMEVKDKLIDKTLDWMCDALHSYQRT
jgi:3-dehydroquinate synthase